jgi:hypothetical protein
MYDGKRIVGIAGRVTAISLAAIILAAVLPCGGFAATQKAAHSLTSEEASPKQIQELMTLLGDPKVRDWLDQQSKAQAASERAAFSVISRSIQGNRTRIVEDRCHCQR